MSDQQRNINTELEKREEDSTSISVRRPIAIIAVWCGVVWLQVRNDGDTRLTNQTHPFRNKIKIKWEKLAQQEQSAHGISSKQQEWRKK